MVIEGGRTLCDLVVSSLYGIGTGTVCYFIWDVGTAVSVKSCVHGVVRYWYIRSDSRLALSQWETSLQSNAVSHWLDAHKPRIITGISHCLYRFGSMLLVYWCQNMRFKLYKTVLLCWSRAVLTEFYSFIETKENDSAPVTNIHRNIYWCVASKWEVSRHLLITYTICTFTEHQRRLKI